MALNKNLRGLAEQVTDGTPDRLGGAKMGTVVEPVPGQRIRRKFLACYANRAAAFGQTTRLISPYSLAAGLTLTPSVAP